MVLALLGIATSGSDEVNGPTIAPQSTKEAAGFFGIAPQTFLTEKDYQRMAAARVSVIRVPLSWNQVQERPGDCQPAPQSGVCNWAGFDQIMTAASTRGIRVFPTLAGRPAFTVKGDPDPALHNHPPIRGKWLAAWQDFVSAAVERYGHDGKLSQEIKDQFGGEGILPIEEWQIWNEPNADAYWPPEPDPAEYAKLLEASADSIRGADPEAEIVLGGMFGTATVSAPDYLDELYSIDGVSEDFDSIAIHPYAPDVKGVEMQAKWAHEAAVRAGDDDVGLWATEVGWGSGNGGHPLEVGAKKQARRLDHAFRLFLDEKDAWNVEGVTWFTWQDRSDHVCRFCRDAGLLDEAGAPKSSWDVFKGYSEAGP